MDVVRFGLGVRALRRRRGMTQSQVAMRAGCSRAVIWRIERGNADRVAVRTLVEVAWSARGAHRSPTPLARRGPGSAAGCAARAPCRDRAGSSRFERLGHRDGSVIQHPRRTRIDRRACLPSADALPPRHRGEVRGAGHPGDASRSRSQRPARPVDRGRAGMGRGVGHEDARAARGPYGEAPNRDACRDDPSRVAGTDRGDEGLDPIPGLARPRPRRPVPVRCTPGERTSADAGFEHPRLSTNPGTRRTETCQMYRTWSIWPASPADCSPEVQLAGSGPRGRIVAAGRGRRAGPWPRDRPRAADRADRPVLTRPAAPRRPREPSAARDPTSPPRRIETARSFPAGRFSCRVRLERRRPRPP